MTDERLIEAFESLIQTKSGYLWQDVLGLLKRQKAEIEELKKFCNVFSETLSDNYKKAELEKWEAVNQAKAEAYNELADKLKEHTIAIDVSSGYSKECYTEAVTVFEIDNVVAELAGEIK